MLSAWCALVGLSVLVLVGQHALTLHFDASRVRVLNVGTPSSGGPSALHQYAAFHKRMLLEEKAQFVVFRISTMHGAGFGNRILAAVSALLVAIVTNRVFLVDDSKLQSGLAPNLILWNARKTLSPSYVLSVGMNINELLGCQNFSSAFASYQAIEIESTQYFAPLVSHNPFFADIVRLLFPKISRMGHELFELAFKPTETVDALVTNFELEFFHSKRTLGVQIRTEHLIDVERDKATFFRFVEHYLDEFGAQRIFVASDSPQVIAHMRNHFGDKVVVYKGQDSALVDLFLLSRTSDFVITWPKSTFGSIAALISGKVPYAVFSGESARGRCAKLLSSEPCFHGWHRRRSLGCYKAITFESFEMLNMDNCYFCDRPRCCPCQDDVPSDVTCPEHTCHID